MKYLAAVLLIATLGCGESVDDLPDTSPVTGKLTLDGKPIEGARILFHPVEGGRSSEATSGADGSYELQYKDDLKGAKVGKHEVVVTTFQEAVGDKGGEDYIAGQEEKIPAKYHPAEGKSEMEVEVKAGEDNTIDLPLTSG